MISHFHFLHLVLSVPWEKKVQVKASASKVSRKRRDFLPCVGQEACKADLPSSVSKTRGAKRGDFRQTGTTQQAPSSLPYSFGIGEVKPSVSLSIILLCPSRFGFFLQLSNISLIWAQIIFKEGSGHKRAL